MIVVDTSALLAVVLGEGTSDACIEVLQGDTEVLISAGTVAEALIVAARRRVSGPMATLFERFDFEIVPVTPASALRIGKAYEQWGKGIHPAGLNFGDCFAYTLAKEHFCPLLHIGDDFSKTDIKSVLQN
jgi:ribonuclease VapC